MVLLLITILSFSDKLVLFFQVDVLLKATGNAPIMKKKKWAVDPDKKIGYLIEFIKRYLKFEPSESLVSLFFIVFPPSHMRWYLNGCYKKYC